MEKVFTHGQMEKSMMANGKWDLNMGTVFGEAQMAIHTLDNGLKIKLKVTVSIFGRIKINMKGNGFIIYVMEMEVIFLIMEISLLDSMLMGNPRASDSISGLTDQFIPVNLKME